MKTELPFDSKILETVIQNNQHVEIIRIQEQGKPIDFEEQIAQALRHPLEASPLQSLVSSNNTVAIFIDDYKRPCPYK